MLLAAVGAALSHAAALINADGSLHRTGLEWKWSAVHVSRSSLLYLCPGNLHASQTGTTPGRYALAPARRRLCQVVIGTVESLSLDVSPTREGLGTLKPAISPANWLLRTYIHTYIRLCGPLVRYTTGRRRASLGWPAARLSLSDTSPGRAPSPLSFRDGVIIGIGRGQKAVPWHGRLFFYCARHRIAAKMVAGIRSNLGRKRKHRLAAHVYLLVSRRALTTKAPALTPAPRAIAGCLIWAREGLSTIYHAACIKVSRAPAYQQITMLLNRVVYSVVMGIFFGTFISFRCLIPTAKLNFLHMHPARTRPAEQPEGADSRIRLSGYARPLPTSCAMGTTERIPHIRSHLQTGGTKREEEKKKSTYTCPESGQSSAVTRAKSCLGRQIS